MSKKEISKEFTDLIVFVQAIEATHGLNIKAIHEIITKIEKTEKEILHFLDKEVKYDN